MGRRTQARECSCFETYLQRAALPGVNLEVNHMLQALVVGGVQENLGLQLPACVGGRAQAGRCQKGGRHLCMCSCTLRWGSC